MTARSSSALLLVACLVPAAAAQAPAKPAAGGTPAPAAKPAEGNSSAANAMKAIDDALTARKTLTAKEDERGKVDEDIIRGVDTLTADFASYDDKTKAEVVNQISKIFQVRTAENDDKIYSAGAAALSEMGPAGETELQQALKLKHIEKKPDVRADIVESIGKHKNPKNIDFFVKLLNESDTKMVRAAIKSLGEFKDADAKTRKGVAEALVKQYANANNLDAKEKGKNPAFHERLIDIETDMNNALASLTLQSFQNSADWEKWFNDNRNKKW